MPFGWELPWERPEQWQRVSRPALVAWLVLYALVLLVPYSRTPIGRDTILSLLAIFPHEGGHLLVGAVADWPIFSLPARALRWLAARVWPNASLANEDVAVALAGAGGQLAAAAWPLIYFFWRKHTPAVAFCLFWFFSNFVGIGIYMLDSRLMTLNYIGPGMNSPEWNPAEAHDWSLIFTTLIIPFEKGERLGRLSYGLGWIGMLGSVAWLVAMHFRPEGGFLSALGSGSSADVPDVVEVGEPGSDWDLRIIGVRPKPDWGPAVRIEYNGTQYKVLETVTEAVDGEPRFHYYLRKADAGDPGRIIHYDPFQR